MNATTNLKVTAIVERKTKFKVSMRINDKTAETVTAATIALLTPFKDSVLTITADNGKEFAYHERIAEALGAKVYFADPYSSWQRGLNENTNGLLRQYWPKLTNFKRVSQKEVSTVITQLNELKGTLPFVLKRTGSIPTTIVNG